MAEAAVSFVLRKLADVALNKALELYHVGDQVMPINLQLRMIQCFLRDAESKGNRNPSVNQWVKEVRSVAYRIEDAMDIFLVEVEENRPKQSGIISKIKRRRKPPEKLDWLSDEIKEIQLILKVIHEGTCQLGIKNIGASSQEESEERSQLGIANIGASSQDESVDRVVSFGLSRLNQPFEIDDSEVVGFHADRDEIINHLLDENIPRRTVLSIVGIGGLGKTTLAKKVFQSIEVKRRFDCCTWLFISQTFNLSDLLREILYSIEPHMKENIPAVKEEDLPKELEKFLSEKRYLIVLDNVWTTDLWDRLKITLPDKKNRSRVLITSRSLDVAIAVDPEIPHHKLSSLTEEESQTLLLKNALPHQQLGNCPFDLMNVAQEITKKCGRLPLALIVLGCILSRKACAIIAWRNLEQSMAWHNKEEDKCSQVLAMSYEHLPYHLKQYFLYFALFPEDHKISTTHVIRMWIAEGFIPKDGAGTLEDKAEIYLEELAQRCLVQVIEKSWNGYCKYCNMHDLLRDLAICKAKENNFSTVFSETEDDNQLDAREVRRAALQFRTYTPHGFHSKNIRSLLIFGQCRLNYHGFSLLRVLTIESVKMSEKEDAYERWLEGLMHLRYLGFRYCGLLPGRFGNVSFNSLKMLETLDVKGTRISLDVKPSDSLWRVPTLRHVISSKEAPLVCNQSKWNHFKYLQTLNWVSLQNFPELGCNLYLRKIGLHLGEDFWKNCGSVELAQVQLKGLLKRMEFLVSLGVYSNHVVPFPIDDVGDLPYFPKVVQRLFLKGTWPRGIDLNTEMFPTNLIKFILIGSKLEQDPMPILEKLQCLRVLQLMGDSYMGIELTCSMGGFPSLQKLHLHYLPNLRSWNIEEGAMCILSHLKIKECDKLHVLPELQKVPALQDLILDDLSDELHKRMESEIYKINHIPSVHIQK